MIGIGEWINHPLQTKVGLGSKITEYPRIKTFSGNLFDIGGIALVIIGVVKIFR